MFFKSYSPLLLVFLIFAAQAITLEASSHELKELPEHDIKLLGKITPPCPSGKTAYDNKIAVVPNGCGSGATQAKIASVLVPYLETLTPCCNAHDICFGTCVSSNYDSAFSNCNSVFKSCMFGKCDEKAKATSAWKREFVKAACKSTATAMYAAV